MKKIDAFSRILDELNNEGKDKLLISAKELKKAQMTVRVESAGIKPLKKRELNRKSI